MGDEVKGCLKRFLAAVEDVPSDVTKSLELVCELDKDAAMLTERVDTMRDEYMRRLHKRGKGFPGLLPKKDRRLLADIGKYHDSSLQKCDRKVELAANLYDLVDEHIRKIDRDLARYESMLHAAASTGKSKKKKSKGKSKSKAQHAAMKQRSLFGTSLVDEAPIDPAEPVYCKCKRVAYGEMIGCDNEDCTVEWFHFGCVGLRKHPTGAWYCDTCKAAMGRKSKKQRTR